MSRNSSELLRYRRFTFRLNASPDSPRACNWRRKNHGKHTCKGEARLPIASIDKHHNFSFVSIAKSMLGGAGESLNKSCAPFPSSLWLCFPLDEHKKRKKMLIYDFLRREAFTKALALVFSWLLSPRGRKLKSSINIEARVARGKQAEKCERKRHPRNGIYSSPPRGERESAQKNL